MNARHNQTGADALLSRLERVKQTGPGRWIARCPAHEDRSPSLSIRECDDGRVLLHDFGGCPVDQVIGAIGLQLSDLFPEKLISSDSRPRERRPFNAGDVLQAVAFEVDLTAIAAANIAQGIELSEADRERLMVAVERLNAAMELCRAG